MSNVYCNSHGCVAEAFRFCVECGYRCTQHPCKHMPEPVAVSQSFLSDAEVIRQMPSEKLSEMRLRLALQIYAIDAELHRRNFDGYRKSGRTSKIKSSDLEEIKSGGRTFRKPKPAAQSETTEFKQMLKSLPKEQLQLLASLVEKSEKGK